MFIEPMTANESKDKRVICGAELNSGVNEREEIKLWKVACPKEQKEMNRNKIVNLIAQYLCLQNYRSVFWLVHCKI